MNVATLDKMQIELMVDESDIGQIKDGQTVEFTVDAYPDETFKGIISLISRSATTTNNVNYYTCYVDVDNVDNKLLPTMTHGPMSSSGKWMMPFPFLPNASLPAGTESM